MLNIIPDQQESVDVDTTGEISDGYHTFNELYEHRVALFMLLMAQNSELSWCSKFHSNAEPTYDDMIIVGMNLPTGQITYHIPEHFLKICHYLKIPELFMAPEWDGHTAQDTVNRLTEWLFMHTKNTRSGIKEPTNAPE